MRLVFVRHGETLGKSSIRFFGKTDIPLSTEGKAQMLAAHYYLKNETFSKVFTSPLCRTIEGARIILGDNNLSLCQIEEFREIDFGRWEGLTLEEIEKKDPLLFSKWQMRLWNFDYPQGDKRAEFINRVESGIDKILNSEEDGNFLLVLHKGIIRTIFYYLLKDIDETFKFEADLGSIHELKKFNGKWIVNKLNYIDHLK